jgi:hypothetical protein
MNSAALGLEALADRAFNRRNVLKGASVAAAGVAAGSLGLAGSANAATYTLTDADVFNFALNLEYLEANYYLLGVTGQALPSSMLGGGPAVTAPATTIVPFKNPQLAYYFQRIASDEMTHVAFIRSVLGVAAVPQPAIDYVQSFTALMRSAALIGPTETFNPFADEIAFITGAYIFEDVGVTAYGGGAAYLTNPDSISYAASILAIEGYHAGAIRGWLASNGGDVTTNGISALRAALSGVADDNGTAVEGNPFNIVNADLSGQSFRRSFNQVLNIVYGGASSNRGLFFPNGLSGTVTDSNDTFNQASLAVI